MRLFTIMLIVATLTLSAKEDKNDCFDKLNVCRAACYATADITSDCILDCYSANDKCLKEYFKKQP